MELVTSSAVLRKKIDKIIGEDYVCIDTEFVREKTYYPTLGLIQVAAGRELFAIDPIDTSIDMEPLKTLLIDPKIVKVFHAGSQDIEIFFHMFGCTPVNMFDTQVGAKMLGFGEAISYSKLVEHYLRKKIDKSHRYTDWTKRPLEDDQLDYAAGDVVYLQDVYEKMCKQLKKQERYEWALEESEKMLDIDNYHVDIDEAWKKLRVKSGDKTYLALLKSLCRWREVTAQNLNKPRPWILKDDAIQEIAAIRPKRPEDLRGLRFFRYDDKLVHEILGVVDHGLHEEKAPKLDKNRALPDSAAPMLALLKILLKAQSVKHDIAASVIADNDDLENIAMGDYKHSRVMKGWRYDIFGQYAEKLRKGRLAITANGNDILLIEPAYA